MSSLHSDRYLFVCLSAGDDEDGDMGACLVEASTQHSQTVIELLTFAYSQFQRRQCSRTMLYIASEIASEYKAAGKFDDALKYAHPPPPPLCLSVCRVSALCVYILTHGVCAVVLCMDGLGSMSASPRRIARTGGGVS